MCPVHRNHPFHGRGFLHRAPGAKQQTIWGFVIFWGLSFPGIIFLAPKMRTGSTKCLTRKLLLRIGAALGNGGLRKREPGPGALTMAQGSEASLRRGALGKAQQ